MNNPNSISSYLTPFKQKYRAELPIKVAIIFSDWNEFRTEWALNVFDELIRECHTLIGSSGALGFTSVCSTAREIETYLKMVSFEEGYATTNNLRLINEISLKIIELTQVVQTLDEVSDGAPKSTMTNKTPDSIASEKDYLIYYLNENPNGAEIIIEQLDAYGFKCIQFGIVDDLLNNIRDAPPGLVLLDLSETNSSCTKIFKLASEIIRLGPKVFILSDSNNFDYQLSAVRVGAHAYIEKSSGIAFIVSRIRSVLQLYGNRPSKVLIVDDERTVAEVYAAVLRDVGMIVQVEVSPSDVLHIMHETMPDLVLLDVSMPNVSGLELAAIIRQQELFYSIPIVFLTGSETYTKSSLLELGTDVLLKYEISLNEFILQIKSRVNRAKALAAKMYKDSLTGLLNHAQIQRSLEKEFSRSKRFNSQLSIAMIDIDRFKAINDSYGHLAGDKVIIALSNLLDQRLRSTDYIGRFGGEEFLVIMPDCNLENARNLIDNIRTIFSKLKFEHSGNEFSVSFSAGISGAEGISTSLNQLKVADDALYDAKKQGRNLVLVKSEANRPV